MNNSWKNNIIYQIYPRSFKDSSGNGVGDLKGIIEKVDYIKDLGIDYVWISPFFKSPQHDFGYDVEDYREVDPLFGSKDDLRKLIDTFHNKNLKVMIDLVLSHTSTEHKWFKLSNSKDKNPYTDWYVWSKGIDGNPPNNWLSVFGGSSWKWSKKREEFYLHNFLEQQADLNFHNHEVQNQMLEEIEYWLRFGIDGFRFDVINFLFHDKELRDNPLKDPKAIRPLGFNKDNPYGTQSHIYDNTRPEMLPFLEKVRSLLDKYDAISVGEIVADNFIKVMGDYTTNKRLHMAYNFEFLSEEFNFNKVDNTVDNFFSNNPDSWPCWAFSNHDSKRIVSRSNMDAKKLLEKLLCQKGNICIYQGEELGLTESEIKFEDIKDPFGKNFWPDFKGRDGCRTPMPWEALKPNFGFSNSKPWLPPDTNFQELSVDIQSKDRNSTLNYFKALVKKRRSINF